MKKVSVIVPVYNAIEFFPKCLNSICNQTYRELEIICVDDGSTDGAGQVADEFAQKDFRIKVIHKANGGESSARNAGLKIASGEYIAFCDCDDWLDEEMYKTLVQTMESEETDMVASSWYREINTLQQEIKNQLPVSESTFGRNDLLRYLYMRDSYRGFAYMWNKLYRREILYDKRGNMIFFDETLRLGGDVLYLAEIALNAKRVKYIDRAFYHYCQREKSGCHTKDVNKLRDWIKAYEKVIKKFEDEKIEDEIVEYVKRFLAYHSSNAAEIAIGQGQEMAKREFQGIMRQYEQEYISLNQQHPERIERYYDLLNR